MAYNYKKKYQKIASRYGINLTEKRIERILSNKGKGSFKTSLSVYLGEIRKQRKKKIEREYLGKIDKYSIDKKIINNAVRSGKIRTIINSEINKKISGSIKYLQKKYGLNERDALKVFTEKISKGLKRYPVPEKKKNIGWEENIIVAQSEDKKEIRVDGYLNWFAILESRIYNSNYKDSIFFYDGVEVGDASKMLQLMQAKRVEYDRFYDASGLQSQGLSHYFAIEYDFEVIEIPSEQMDRIEFVYINDVLGLLPK